MNSRRVFRAIACSATLAGALIGAGTPAHATCAALGGIVSCTADDTNGFFSTTSITSVTVNSGVTVSDTVGGNGATGGSGVGVIEIFDGAFGGAASGVTGAFVNNGTITDTGAINFGVYIEGILGGGFINNGTITGLISAVDVDGLVSGGFVNNGTLTGGIDGVFFLTNISGGFFNTGTITGTTFFGVNALDISGGFNNSGTITGLVNGIDTTDIFGGFVNSGIITGTNFFGVNATDIFGGFSNSGTITGLVNGVDTTDIFGGFVNSGMITGTNNDGINTTAINGGFTNSGSITGDDDAIDTGDISGGFSNTGTLSGITGDGANINGSVTGNFDNSGSIIGSGLSGNGVSISGTLTGDVFNSGTITGTDDGFDVDGPLVGNFTNSGSISATGTGGDNNGVDLTSVSGRFLNTGSISGTEAGVAVEAGTIAGGFTNRGHIIGDSDGNGTGDGVKIVSAAGQSATFSNEPDATITGVIGFHSEAGNETLINGGTITGTGGTSIDLGTGDDTLSILPSSILIGLIDMGAGSNVLNVANGLNLAATFTGAVPGTINTNGAPLIINGNQVLVIDASGFTGAGLYLGDLTTSIFNAVDGNAGGGPASPLTTAALGYGEAPNIPAGPSIHVWATGIGGYSEAYASGTSVDHKHGFGGAIAGIERRMSGAAFGFFGGGAQSRIATSTNAQDTDVTTVLGGVYYKRDSGSHWLNMILSGGWSGHNFQRRIANNLAPTGIEFADSDFNGFFLAPALTIGVPIPNTAATASLRVNYAGLFLGSYSETGASSSLSFSGREIHIAGARAQLAMPVATHFQNGATTLLQARIGADGQFSIASDSVNAAIGAGSVRFSAGEIDRISGFFGADLSHTTSDGRNEFRASFEALTTFDGSYNVNGQLKAIHRF